MGSCVSVHKDPESAVRFRLVMGSKDKKLFAPNSPSHGKMGAAQNGGHDSGAASDADPGSKRVDSDLSSGSPDFGGKDEAFFDTRAWLESDCEDDFFSVNGEFTPSRGSTPNFQTGTTVTPRLNKSFLFDGFPDTKSEPSPRKKLAELLQETLPGEPAGDEYNVINGGKVGANRNLEVNKTTLDKQPLKSSDGTPYQSGANSVCSGERTLNADFKNGKEKRGKAMQCCLPSLVHNLSFNERKKQMPSPGHRGGG